MKAAGFCTHSCGQPRTKTFAFLPTMPSHMRVLLLQACQALVAGMQEVNPRLGRSDALLKIRRKWNNVREASKHRTGRPGSIVALCVPKAAHQGHSQSSCSCTGSVAAL